MIIGIDARIPLVTGRGWGRYTCELIAALASTAELELRVLLPRAALADALVERIGASSNVRSACVDFFAASPDHYREAAGDTTIEDALGAVDLVHSPTRFILPTAIRPLVATVHDIAPLADPLFKPAYRRATLEALDFIRQHRVRLITVSESTRRELAVRGGLDVQDAVVVHPGAAAVFRTSAAHAATRASDYLLYVGGAGPNKNLQRLIAAVRLLRRRHPLPLLIAGDRAWDQEELQHALGADVPSWIAPTGYVTDRDLAGLYRRAALCVVPSLHEGFGLPLLEAMACGTPVACSRIPVFEEVAGDTATYFDPRHSEEMAASVASLLENRAQARERAARAQARAQSFTWEATARKTIAVYRRVLDTGPATLSPDPSNWAVAGYPERPRSPVT